MIPGAVVLAACEAFTSVSQKRRDPNAQFLRIDPLARQGTSNGQAYAHPEPVPKRPAHSVAPGSRKERTPKIS